MKMLMILGMHRSGTSVLAGSCRLLGAELGERMMAAGQDNVMGFWEHDEIVRIHDEILGKLGYAWDDVRALPDKWWNYETVRPQRDALKAVLQRDFGAAELACVKDPRLCRMLPLWQDLLRELGWQPCYLIATRDPAEIIASLKARNGFAPEKSALLTLRYLLDAEAASRGGPRAVVDYAAVLADWRGALKPAWEKLGLAWPADERALDQGMAGFVHKELRHHQKPELMPGGELGRLTRDTYKTLAGGADATQLDRLGKELSGLSAGFDHILGALYAELHARDAALADKDRLIQARDQEIKHIAEERGHHAGLALARAQELEWQRGELRELAHLKQELQALYHSTSWRVTAPLRGLMVMLRSIPKLRFMDAGMLRLVARDVYYRIPMPMRLRMILRRSLGRLFGAGAPGSADYKTRAVRGDKVDPKGPAAVLAGEGLVLATSETPEVSVVIPVYNNALPEVHCRSRRHDAFRGDRGGRLLVR